MYRAQDLRGQILRIEILGPQLPPHGVIAEHKVVEPGDRQLPREVRLPAHPVELLATPYLDASRIEGRVPQQRSPEIEHFVEITGQSVNRTERGRPSPPERGLGSVELQDLVDRIRRKVEGAPRTKEKRYGGRGPVVFPRKVRRPTPEPGRTQTPREASGLRGKRPPRQARCGIVRPRVAGTPTVGTPAESTAVAVVSWADRPIGRPTQTRAMA